MDQRILTERSLRTARSDATSFVKRLEIDTVTWNGVGLWST